MLLALEINLAVLLFMPAADVPGGQPAIIVPAAASLLDSDETLMRLRFRDLGKSWKRLETKCGSKWRKILESHNH